MYTMLWDLNKGVTVSFNKTTDKYLNDPYFHTLVDLMLSEKEREMNLNENEIDLILESLKVYSIQYITSTLNQISVKNKYKEIEKLYEKLKSIKEK